MVMRGGHFPKLVLGPLGPTSAEDVGPVEPPEKTDEVNIEVEAYPRPV